MSEFPRSGDADVITFQPVTTAMIPEVVDFFSHANQAAYAEPLGIQSADFETAEYYDNLGRFVNDNLIDDRSQLLLMRLNGQTAGAIGTTTTPNLRTVRIWGNRVATRLQGLGIGVLLVEKALEPAIESGVKDVVAEVNQVPDGAQRFYQRIGMRATGNSCRLSPILPEGAGTQRYSEHKADVRTVARTIASRHKPAARGSHLQLVS